MSYGSRVYRQRNAHVHDKVKLKPNPFFNIQKEQDANKIQRQVIPDDLKLPCKWGDYIFEDHTSNGVRVLVGMAQSERESIPPLKDITSLIANDNKTISDPKFKVTTCIISPNTTRFALFSGEPVLMIDPSDANLESIRHEMGHAVFHFLNHNKEVKIHKDVKAGDKVLELTDVFLQLRAIKLKKGGDQEITANMIVDPSEWKPQGRKEHPDDVDEFFASAKEAYQSDRKALEQTFNKYGSQNKKVAELGIRLLALLASLLGGKASVKKQSLVSSKNAVDEQIKSLSEPSKVEETIGVHQLTDMLVHPDKRKNCKKIN